MTEVKASHAEGRQKYAVCRKRGHDVIITLMLHVAVLWSESFTTFNICCMIKVVEYLEDHPTDSYTLPHQYTLFNSNLFWN